MCLKGEHSLKDNTVDRNGCTSEGKIVLNAAII